MYDRNPRESCCQFNMFLLNYFCVDYIEVWMITQLPGKGIRFLSFNQGSSGAWAGRQRGQKYDFSKHIQEEVLDNSVVEMIIKLVSNPKFAAMMQEEIDRLAPNDHHFIMPKSASTL